MDIFLLPTSLPIPDISRHLVIFLLTQDPLIVEATVECTQTLLPGLLQHTPALPISLQVTHTHRHRQPLTMETLQLDTQTEESLAKFGQKFCLRADK
jgi:hypothetical protein